MPKKNLYNDDAEMIDDYADLDDMSNGPDENCSHYDYAEDLNIIETNVDDDPDIDVDSISKYIKRPKDVIKNTSINYDSDQLYTPEKPDSVEEDNFFQIHDSEMDGYREDNNYGYEQNYNDENSRKCNEVKRCRKACNKVHKKLCNQFNCNRLITIFKQKCQEKCEELFSDPNDEIDYYDNNNY